VLAFTSWLCLAQFPELNAGLSGRIHRPVQCRSGAEESQGNRRIDSGVERCAAREGWVGKPVTWVPGPTCPITAESVIGPLAAESKRLSDPSQRWAKMNYLVTPCSASRTSCRWSTYKGLARDRSSKQKGSGRTTTDGISRTRKDCERLSLTVLVEHIDDLLVPNQKWKHYIIGPLSVVLCRTG
jgi:hypothetical protein